MLSAFSTDDPENTARIVVTGQFPQARLTRRAYREHFVPGGNAHKYWYRVRNSRDGRFLGPLRIVLNYVVIYAARHAPSLSLKRWVFQRLGMKLGKDVTIASGAVLDYFFPELITIGDHTIVGMDAMILAHEFLQDRYREGEVVIGKSVLVGAQSTILAGVRVGDGARISAKSLVHKSVPAATFVGGVPVQVIREASDDARSRSLAP